MNLVFTGFLLIKLILQCFGGKVKLVEEPFSFNNAFGNNGLRGERLEPPLLTRYLPNSPAGPPYLIDNLYGKCFDHTENNYKYRLCPFQNVTQKEQSYRWNAFHGILGVWKSWEIENGTFDSMLMAHGDICQGNLDRQTKVILLCGKKEEILSVTEPTMCHYEMKFKTRYACPKDVFEVYPVLSKDGRSKYEHIEELYLSEELTLKGYNYYMKELFAGEGLLLDTMVERKALDDHLHMQRERSKNGENINKKIKFEPKNEFKIGGGGDIGENSVESYITLMDRFSSKSQCVEKYREALQEIEMLRNHIREMTLQQLKGVKDLKNILGVEKKEFQESISTTKITDENISEKVSILKTKTNDLKNYTSNEDSNQTITAAKIHTTTKLSNSKDKKNKGISGLKRKGDDGVLDENENPQRDLQSSMSYMEKLRMKMKAKVRNKTIDQSVTT